MQERDRSQPPLSALAGLRVLDLSRDLSSPAGRTVLERLLDGADVLIENFLPGTMEKWGLGYEATLAARHPGLIYCRVSGFGADGLLGGCPATTPSCRRSAA